MTLPWSATVLTLFPEMFPGPLAFSIAGKSLDKNLWRLQTLNIRDFATDKHKTVDDTPYGGGVGLVMKPDIVDAALIHATSIHKKSSPTYVYFTPRGKPLTQEIVKTLSFNPDGIILLCGRYEGVDDRVIKHWKDEKNLIELSIGDYVLSGGEMAALVLLDACIRLLPGVLIKEEATTNESFESDLLEFSQYTKPRVWQNKTVPDVLLSGDHAKIQEWRKKSAEEITKERRPDLWQSYCEQQEKA